jgi:hypothetical protein
MISERKVQGTIRVLMSKIESKYEDTYEYNFKYGHDEDDKDLTWIDFEVYAEENERPIVFDAYLKWDGCMEMHISEHFCLIEHAVRLLKAISEFRNYAKENIFPYSEYMKEDVLFGEPLEVRTFWV